MKYKILTIIIAAVLFNFCSANDASADWTEGKYGSAMEFNGTTTFVDGFGALGSVKTVCFWVKASLTTDKIIEMKSGTYIEVLAETITATGFTSPTIYVDGKISSTLADANWHHIAITTDTIVDASAVRIGKTTISAADYFFTGTLDEVKIYAYARSAEEIRLDYNAGVATHLGPSGKTCLLDPASCMDYGLVGSWGMDEGAGTMAYDSSDEGNDGSLTNGPKWTTDSPPFQGGAGGGSLKFDGVDDYVDCGNDASLKPNYFTATAWIKTNELPFTTWHFIAADWDGVDRSFEIQGYDGQSYLRLVLTTTTGNTTLLSSNITKDVWIHVVTSWDGTNLKFYLNGQPDTSVGYSGTMINSGNPLYIGWRPAKDHTPWNGSIDSVRIYNRALSAEEVRYHYNKGGPVAEWKFDEGEGTTAFDSSINRNKGTLTNFDWTATSGWGEGKYGSGLVFDGVDDYVDAGNGASLGITGAITVGAWVKSVENGTYQGIVTKQHGTDYTGYAIVRPSSDKFSFIVNDGISRRYLNSDSTYTDSGWHHIIGVRRSGTNYLYIDGVVQSSTHTYPILSNSETVDIGKYYSNILSEFFNGSIDDVRIYNYARTADQIRMDYQQGVGTRF